MPDVKSESLTPTQFSPGESSAVANPDKKILKILVAVHGIGDQTAYATVQSVAARLSAHRGRRVATPLGRFYTAVDAGPQLMSREIDGEELEGFVLAETYWAPIPREIVQKKFVLEDTKRWAESIAARVAYRESGGAKVAARRVDRLVAVLNEMIETIRVLERLSFLAEKAGVFKFDLARLLIDFVGDVQVVADFQGYRDDILAEFDRTIQAALTQGPHGKNVSREVYLVAHSEGTVITFLALLHALSDPVKYGWIRYVRGLMTIGSPIEVHHLLWPSLWKEPKVKLAPSADSEGIVIRWHNYMDYGDPIAYDLKKTSEWLRTEGFDRHLRPLTHAFSRYPLPGKAHVDYWNDAEVFGHFFETVAGIPRAGGARFEPLQPGQAETADRKLVHPVAEGERRLINAVTGAAGAVKSKLWVPAATLLLPYALVLGLLFMAVYTFEHAVGIALHIDYTMARLRNDVIGVGLLLFGVTAAARLPRIADGQRWWVFGGLGLLLSMLGFSYFTSPQTQADMGGQMASVMGLDPSVCFLSGIGLDLGCAGGGLGAHSLATWALALAVAVLASIWARIFPRRGHYMLPALGLVAALFIVAAIGQAEAPEPQRAPSLWPLVVGGIFFFYLWWLAAMLFDLAFIWRRYTRGSAIREHLERLR